MANRGRRFLRRLSLLIVVLVLVGAGIRFFFPGERVGRLFATAFSERTGGTAVFKTVTLGLKPDLRLIFTNGTLIGTGEQLAKRGFGENGLAKYLVRFRGLEISVSWREMLARRIRIKGITLRAPQIELVTRELEVGQTEIIAGLPLALAGFNIRDGSLRILQLGTGLDLSIEQWQQDVSAADIGVLVSRSEAFLAGKPSLDRIIADSRLDLQTCIGFLQVATGDRRGPIFSDLLLEASVVLPNAADHIGIELQGLEFKLTGFDAPFRVTSRVNIFDRMISVDDLKIDAVGGSLGGRLIWNDYSAGRSHIDFDLDGDRLPVSILDRCILPGCLDYLTGMANLDLTGSLVVENKRPDWSSLDLSGRIALSDGVIHGTEMMDDISPYLGQRQDLKEIRFYDLSHDIRLYAGKYHIDNLELNGPDTDWRGRGWFVAGGAIDMALGVKFPRDFQPDLGGFTLLTGTFKDADDRLTLDLRLSGQANHPDVALDLGRSRQSIEQGARVLKGFLDKLKSK